HVLDDSGPPIDAPGARFADWVASWDLEAPPGCADCTDGLSRLLPHYSAAMPPGDRYAYLGFESDAVVALYWGEGVDAIAAKQAALRDTLAAAPAFNGFFLSGTEHVVLTSPGRATSGGVSAEAWVEQLVAGDPAWDTVGP